MQASVSLMFQLLYDVLCDLPLPYHTQPLTNKELCVTHSFVLTTEHANTPLAIVVSAFLRSGKITCFPFSNLYKSFLDTWNCVFVSFFSYDQHTPFVVWTCATGIWPSSGEWGFWTLPGWNGKFSSRINVLYLWYGVVLRLKVHPRE